MATVQCPMSNTSRTPKFSMSIMSTLGYRNHGQQRASQTVPVSSVTIEGSTRKKTAKQTNARKMVPNRVVCGERSAAVNIAGFAANRSSSQLLCEKLTRARGRKSLTHLLALRACIPERGSEKGPPENQRRGTFDCIRSRNQITCCGAPTSLGKKFWSVWTRRQSVKIG